MGMTQYTSIHSGVDIDRAVSYYKSIDSYGRTILSVKITENDWKDVNSATGTDKEKLAGVTTKHYVKITLSGTYKLGGAPLVYFVDSNGQQYYIDHIFTPTKTGEEFDPTNIQNIYCLSNKKIAGAIVITCNLTDIKTIVEGGTGPAMSASISSDSASV